MSSIYSPLRDDKAEIRLLKLEPAPSIDNIVVCSLHVSSSDDQPDFEALSYCWGDPAITKICLLNGVEWAITVNLECALRYLRHPTKSIIMWVDAVCINQQDVQERNHQLALMKAIYSSASTVRVWLGESADRSDEVIQTIHTLANIDLANEDVSTCLYDIWLDGQCLANDDLIIAPPWLPCFRSFAHRPWWSRTWVLQEVILARSAIVHCGYQHTPMEDFFKVAEAIRRLSLIDMGRFHGIMQSIGPLIVVIIQFEDIRGLLGAPESSIADLCSQTLQILSGGWSQEVTDPRDRIYGMLGIVPDVVSQLRLDYTCSVEQVYTDYALRLAETSQSLSIFEFVVGIRNPLLKLPSWVPDWSVRQQAGYLRSQYGMNDHWKACGRLDFFIHVISSTTVRLRGIPIGIIDSVGDMFVSSSQTKDVGVSHREGALQYQTYLQWFRMWGNGTHGKVESEAAAFNVLRTILQTISNCLTIDEETRSLIVLTAEDMMFDNDVFSRWWRWLRSTTQQSSYAPPDAHVTLLQGYVSMVNEHKRFVTTIQGDMGTAPAAVLPGHVVYVLGGGKQAYVLRPVNDALQQPTFTLVGPCYLQGYMRGEATVAEGWTSKCHDVYLQ